jgi:hypothetical protein
MLQLLIVIQLKSYMTYISCVFFRAEVQDSWETIIRTNRSRANSFSLPVIRRIVLLLLLLLLLVNIIDRNIIQYFGRHTKV